MAYLDKQYKFEKEENFESFLKSAGLPDEQIKVYLEYKPTSKLVKNGDSYTYISGTPEGIKETTFKSGVEIEDTIQNVPIKSTYTVDGNNIKQVIKSAKGNATFSREYKGNELIVTITSSVWDGEAKRYYKA